MQFLNAIIENFSEINNFENMKIRIMCYSLDTVELMDLRLKNSGKYLLESFFKNRKEIIFFVVTNIFVATNLPLGHKFLKQFGIKLIFKDKIKEIVELHLFKISEP